MGIKFRNDNDLVFLKYCDNDDLKILIDILTLDKDGDQRLTEELLSEKRYEKCNGNYTEIWDLIAGELQLFGADTIVSNLFRGGKGVLYRKILKRVCKKFRVRFNRKSTIDKNEEVLLLKILEKSLDKMNENERREFAQGIGLNIPIFSITTANIIIAIRTSFLINPVETYYLYALIANSVARAILGRGLTIAAEGTILRGLIMFSGPIGLIISSIITIPMLTGPAYRVIIPSVIQVAFMRQKLLTKKNNLI